MLPRWIAAIVLALLIVPSLARAGEPATFSGVVVAPDGRVVVGATVTLRQQHPGRAVSGTTDGSGRFSLSLPANGAWHLTVQAPGFQAVDRPESIDGNGPSRTIALVPLPRRNESITVTADLNQVDVASPDPGEKVFVRQDLLDANPGRPGAPVSIPGYPIETASGGIKAPQYFAPGVAGDHGEPIAQYLALGSYLIPNNLSANAHGNGYADPNLFIPETLESVAVNGGAFNVREGNHAVNLAAIHGLRPQLAPFATLTGDPRDLDLVAGFSPAVRSWAAFEAAQGNGFLARLEHRQQYKLEGGRVVQLARHTVSLLGIAYYGQSYVPGLVPLFALNAGDPGVPTTGDTIDPRQHDQTHTALVAANDAWALTPASHLDLSGFFRTYNLSLFSNFGQGLIRQSEFRTVTGASTAYTRRFSDAFTLLTGLDYEREAPRRDNLDHFDNYTPGNLSDGPFTKVDSNNITISPVTLYLAFAGSTLRYLRYYAGWRRDQIEVDNQDLLTPANSFHRWTGLNSPKATLAFTPAPAWHAPTLALSFGESFFTEDPRIGIGTASGSAVATSHSYQLVAGESLAHTDFKLTLGHTTSSAELGKIDPDTGLQFDLGPSRLLFLTAALRHTFSRGSILATFSKADARDRDSGQPTPEAPRLIADLLGSVDRLPLGLAAHGEFEYVGAKPLGTGCLPDQNVQCTGVPVREIRAALARTLLDGHLSVGINLLIASGYSGQTTENFGSSTIQEVVGVRIPSNASANLTWHFGAHPPKPF
jgi:hypothetical protein